MLPIAIYSTVWYNKIEKWSTSHKIWLICLRSGPLKKKHTLNADIRIEPLGRVFFLQTFYKANYDTWCAFISTDCNIVSNFIVSSSVRTLKSSNGRVRLLTISTMPTMNQSRNSWIYWPKNQNVKPYISPSISSLRTNVRDPIPLYFYIVSFKCELKNSVLVLQRLKCWNWCCGHLHRFSFPLMWFILTSARERVHSALHKHKIFSLKYSRWFTPLVLFSPLPWSFVVISYGI